MTLFLSLSVTTTTREVIFMWIKTVGGYLLNTDHLTFIQYDSDQDYTRGYDGEVHHIISEGNYVDTIATAITQNIRTMEVR